MREELQFHIEQRTEHLASSGVPREEAARRARLEFGAIESYKESCREARGLRFIDELRIDLRYALRSFGKNRGFMAVAVLTLALGIGVNTAGFSLMDALVVKMLPVRNPQELVGILDSVSFPAYKKLRDRNRLFSGLAATSFFRADARVSAEVESAQGQLVTGNYYSVLGIDAALGRVLTPGDDQIPGIGGPQGPVAVISFGYWKRRFALDPSVLGKSITLNGVPFTIAGVTSPRFFGVALGANSIDITVPMMLQPRVAPDSSKELWVNGQQGSVLEYDGSDWGGWRLMIARLKPGVGVAQARAELNVLYQQIVAERGSSMDEHRRRASQERKLAVLPAGNGIFRDGFDYLPDPGQYTTFHLVAIMAAPALVLLIACANVANLLLVRAAARQKEVALRLAIGAGRSRLIRQFLTESSLLALTGGALGVALGGWGRDLLLAQLHYFCLPLETDTRMLIFGVAATLATVILLA